MKSLFEKKTNAKIVLSSIIILIILVAGFLKPKTLPKRTSYWESPPNVLLCNTLSDSLVDNSLNSAKYWEEDLGFEIKDVIQNYNCIYNDDKNYERIYIEGAIIVYPEYKLVGQERAGLTLRVVDDKTKKNLAVIIEIKENKGLALKHEFGHAFGFEHTNIVGHLMSENLSEVGNITEGLSPDVVISER